MSGPFLTFNASLRRAATRPRSVVRAIVAMLVSFMVATPVSAALCAASMTAPQGHDLHISLHDGHSMAGGGAAHDNAADCCEPQVTVDLTAAARSPDADSLAVTLHLLALAGPSTVIHDASWSRDPIRAGVPTGLPPPESVFRRLPRLLL